MLDLTTLDLDEIATALADQNSYEHRWLLDTRISTHDTADLYFNDHPDSEPE